MKSTAWIAAGTLSSRILGLFRDIIMAAMFSRSITDAWLVAFRIPNLARRLFGEGSLSVSFLPVYVSVLTSGADSPEKSEAKARELASAVHALLIMALGCLSVLGFYFAPLVIQWLAPGEGFQDVPGKVEITILLTRIMMGFVLLVCLYAYYMALLNSHKRFGLPAFAPALMNVGIIASCLLPQNWLPVEGEMLAWGVIAGGIMQLALVVYGLYRIKTFPGISFRFNTPELRSVVQKLIPSFLGLGVLQLTVIINTRFASYLDEGANSWIFWADRILEFPLSLFAVSMGTALLPTLSEFWSKGQLDKMVALMNRSLRYVFYISIPAGVGIYFLAHEIISVIFKRGQFSELDVANTGLVLGVYGAAIFAYAGLRVLQPAFYAAQNTWLPALISCLMLVVHYFLAQEMMARYELFGLAASSTVSASLNLFILLCCFRFMVGRIGGMVMLSSLSKIIAGSLVMGVWLKFVKQFWVSDSILGGIAFLVIAISGAVFVYLITTYVLRSPEFVQVKEKIQARLNRKALAK